MFDSSLIGVLQSLADYSGPIIGLLSSLLVGVLLAWFCWYTKSTHLLRVRVWRILLGKSAVNNPDMAKWKELREQLIAFRFYFGRWARTWKHAQRVMTWSEDNDEDISDINACGRFFDHEKCELRVGNIPGEFRQFFEFLGAFACAMIFVIAALFMIPDRALLRMKEGGHWFALSSTAASVIFSGDVLGRSDCKLVGPRPQTDTSFTQDEIATICQAWADPDATAVFLKKVVVEQRVALGYLAFVFGVFGVLWSIALKRGVAAQRMRDRLADRAKLATAKGDGDVTPQACARRCQCRCTSGPPATRWKCWSTWR